MLRNGERFREGVRNQNEVKNVISAKRDEETYEGVEVFGFAMRIGEVRQEILREDCNRSISRLEKERVGEELRICDL